MSYIDVGYRDPGDDGDFEEHLADLREDRADRRREAERDAAADCEAGPTPDVPIDMSDFAHPFAPTENDDLPF